MSSTTFFYCNYMIGKKNKFKINQILKYNVKKNHQKLYVEGFFFFLKDRPSV